MKILDERAKQIKQTRKTKSQTNKQTNKQINKQTNKQTKAKKIRGREKS